MLKTLIIIRMQSMFAGMFSRSNKKKTKTGAGTKILFVFLAIYVVVCFGALFGMVFHSICEPFYQMGLGWLYFGFMALMVFLLCFIGSVFVTQNQLYDATDNDLLLSMPVPPKYILISRILALVFLNYIYEILIVTPAAIVWCIYEPVNPLGVVFFIIGILLLPLLVISVSALFGWIIALANTRMRNKNIITMVLTLILFLAYMYFCFTMQDYITKLVNNGSAIGEAIQKALPPFYHFGVSIFEGSVSSFGIFIVWCIVPFAVVYRVLAVSFIKIATTNRGEKKIQYREKSMKVSGVNKALLLKEIRHFTGSPMYMFNAGIGVVFTLIGAVYLVIKKDAIMKTILMILGSTDGIGPAICLGFAVMSAMTIISSPTISIEGKTLWICQSIPVPTKNVLLAKANMHIVVSLIFLIPAEILLVVAFKLSVLSIILVLIFPVVVTVFDALLGLVFNLKYPKFDWINETAAIKQGASPMLSMLVSAAVVILPAIIYVFLLDDILSAEYFTCILTVVFMAAVALLYKYIVTKGVIIFESLQSE